MKINAKRMVDEFIALVSMDSLSYQEDKIAAYLKKQLISLGFEVVEDHAGAHYQGTANNIYGYLKGSIPGDALLFSAHMDTVAPGSNKKAILHEDGKITSDGTTVLGADDLSTRERNSCHWNGSRCNFEHEIWSCG